MTESVLLRIRKRIKCPTGGCTYTGLWIFPKELIGAVVITEFFSSDDPKLEKWTDHGIVFSNTPEKTQVPWHGCSSLFAPDAIEKNGKYYLYVCGPGGFEGVAVSDKPYGPFGDAVPIAHVDGDGIDPAVFVDDDGSAYLLWGQFSLRGGKLNEDMSGIDPKTLNASLLTEQEHGFHEGASLRKRNGKYYLVYADISRGRASCLSYAMADNYLYTSYPYEMYI